jgi:hypothetical protein
VVYNCAANNDVWQSAGLQDLVRAQIQHCSSAQAVILAICSGEDKLKAGLFATTVWTLWNNRNNKVWNDVAESGRTLGFKAKQYWEEWIMVQNLQQHQLPIMQQQPTTWDVPPYGWLKCNVDAGFHRELNKTSLG